METGASVPGYSGGFAACAVVSYSDLLQPWVADPGRRAERLSERLFGMGPDAKKRIRSRVLRDVA